MVLGLFLAPIAHAEVPNNVFFFGDGKGYNSSGDQLYFCLADGNCYTIEGKFAFQREIQSAPVSQVPQNTQQTVYVPLYVPQNLGQGAANTPTVSEVVTPTPTPTQTTSSAQSVTTTTTIQTPEPTPYAVGAPSVYTEKYRLIRDGQVVGWEKIGDEYRSWKLGEQIISTEKTGEKVYLFSHDNITWFAGYDDNFHNPRSSIPYQSRIAEDLNSNGYTW